MTERRRLAEGKTKVVWEARDAEVFIESKDAITAGDGARRDLILGKGALANETTCNCFELLKRADIPTHFIRKVDDTTFRAWRARMVPFELVARRIATGSYLKRHPEVDEGTKFEDLVVEFFLKDDARHDPLVVLDAVSGSQLLYDPAKPIAEGFLAKEPLESASWYLHTFAPTAKHLLVRTFEVLEEAWVRQQVTLVDLKIECGIIPERRIVVADVIDNDSWRIWPKGEKSRMMDKQVYRDLPKGTPKALWDIHSRYTWVARATGGFLS